MKAAFKTLAALAVALTLAACGGGSSDTPTASAPATQSVTGTMVKTAGSTISVNGRMFNVSRATVRINGASATAADLRTGMRVQVKGKSDNNGNNEATEVESDAEVRGAVTAVDAASKSFSIGTTKVVTDTNTVFDDLTPASFDAIKEGVVVEVDGTRNAAGDIVATRVEGKTTRAGGGGEDEKDELRGPVTAVGTTSITIGTTVVNVTATTTFAPSTCSLASIKTGAVVEAHGTFAADGSFSATRIECEDAGNGSGEMEDNEVEGLVSGLNTTDKTFTVDTRAVKWTDTTKFKDGTAADLANDVRVEVKGTLDGTTLVATEIEIKARR